MKDPLIDKGQSKTKYFNDALKKGKIARKFDYSTKPGIKK